MVTININGKDVQVAEGTTILAAAKKIGVKIPTLCYNPDLPAWASCGICIVRLAGTAKMLRACCTAATNGMKLITHDPEITKARRTVLELILSNHPSDCLQCSRSGQCELQTLAAEFGLRDTRFRKILKEQPVDDSYEEIVLDRDKCINCGRCVEACQIMQNAWALEYSGRGDKTVIGPVAGAKLADSPCIKCGQCAAHCPVGAITTHNPLQELWNKLADETLTSAVQIAPSVRAALGEEFDLPVGTITTQKIYTALRMMGFKYVFDTNFAADLTIMEEGTELVERLTKGGALPMFTSCCPGWVDYAEKHYHDMLPHLSTAKSPQQMQGAVTKTYWAEQAGLKPEQIFSVSIMPCTAKAYEARRNDDMKSSGASDVDLVLTTRELAMLIRQAGIDFVNLEESAADNPLGPYSGAGTIFGATGGVMEAAVRTAYALVTKKELGNINLTPVRGLEAVKASEIDLDGTKIRVAVVHQMGNVDKVVQQVREALAAGKEPPYHFIEVMACRGGCVAGGGQPYGATDEVRSKRAAALYRDDDDCAVRVSHKNPEIVKLYDRFLGKPCSEKSHHLLHTKYTARSLYKE
ncbi:NADH-dependent [FeFe] hydrogenase, group A6 [Treponema brennaborense]|uniref:Hydrogenase, Fe-only n=1 Tax=Treponema brennaborense (strain DSM 12168 / CIP 105900 / DD5/3) TaxID=906968 RepID=F4LMZ5_TREBD|nr:NADH-dependent [FeFe] hydrogenase, group A6 [Treponema brennaborense]AEE15781.1 hydrogenase, Fe-only [Treponema brennaborense DSM 12168]